MATDYYNSKHDLLLRICNIVMTSLGRQTITQLEEFNNISKNQLTRPEIKGEIDKLSNQINELFPMSIEKFRKSKTSKIYILSILRSMCKEVGYNFKQKRSVTVNYIPNNQKKKTKKQIKTKEFGECIYYIKKCKSCN